jgi:N4-gp56 family major capsid protein
MAMASGAIGSSNIDVTRAAVFIPELWSDEVLASYKKRLVMANLVQKFPFVGKKGDTLRIPIPHRGYSEQKLAKTAVNFQFDTDTDTTIVIDQHWYVGKIIEDIVDWQAKSSHRRAITQDMGYQLAKTVDTHLHQLARESNNGAGTNVYATGYIGGDGATAYVAGSNNATALTDAGLRKLIQKLDDNDVPNEDRFMVIPPVVKHTIWGIARFTEQAFVGESGGSNTIRNGKVAELYGMPFYVTTNCDAASGSTATKVCIIGHKDAFALAMQHNVRMQTENSVDYLGTKLVSDVLYGVKNLRDGSDSEIATSSYAVIVPAA